MINATCKEELVKYVGQKQLEAMLLNLMRNYA